MLFILIPLSIAILVGLGYLALSSKAERYLRISAIVVLIIIGLTVLTALVFIFTDEPLESGVALPDMPAIPIKPVTTFSINVVIFSIVFMLIIAAILFLAFRQQKKQSNKLLIDKSLIEKLKEEIEEE
ncbi:hypothetical protein ACYULU_14540 [Breznakiellaceae bacterium SP9]